MADPLSITGLAAGLISLSLQVCGGITKYVEDFKSRDEDIDLLRRKNETVKLIIQTLQESTTPIQTQHPQQASAVARTLQICEGELKAIDSLVSTLAVDLTSDLSLKVRAKNSKKKLKYPFDRTKVKELCARLDQAISSLQLALQSLDM